ncbi:MAG TPA: AAA family ATPase [Ktedonobacterales bacterium]|jgi:predicted kinase
MTGPHLIVLSGLPGTGKSTIAELLAKRLRLPIFSVDPIESAIITAGIAKSFETGLAAYLVAATLADEQIKLGNSVIIDAVNAEEEGKDVWRGLAKKHGVELIILLVALERSLHKQRLESRVRNLHGFSEVTWDKVEARRKEVTPWKEPVLELDASRDVEMSVEMVVEYIETRFTQSERNEDV